jgi:ABC-type branched-subunit amino acid transport system ATPase component
MGFPIDKREIVGVIGAKGADRLTLFNVVSGYYPPTTGPLGSEVEAARA